MNEIDTGTDSDETAARMSEVEKELLWEAFVAGFKLSGEGFNYEYPMHHNDDRVRDEIRDRKRGFEEWYDGIATEGGE
ncbi:hypothetical protein HALG_00021 [Halorubrum virus CGphi46]|uniref:Uncharacterized protein n=1 Tax=Halorubrum virus CGphi46 TaxID=754066 RepID=R9TQN2_9CAUD|nr:hypothetical protein HALG_00021 [Halorubrum virus CGphi46]AGN33809.1 hypothetical protein HALG_00021 [Halorubrum virus CGphi46]